QDIDAHRALATDAITGGQVKHLRDLRIGGDRGATAGGKLLDRIESLGLRAAMLERPELRGQHARRRFEQCRHVDVIGTEANPILAQRGTGALVEALDVLGHFLAVEDAKRLGELKCNAARNAGDVIGGREPKQRLQYSLDVRLEPEVKPRLHRIARCAGEMFVGNDAHAWLERFLAGHELSYRLSEPPDGAVGREYELPVRCLCEPGRAYVDLSRQRLLRRAGERLCFGAGGRRIGRESESVEPADGMPLDHDFAALADVRLEHRVLTQPTHQYAG